MSEAPRRIGLRRADHRFIAAPACEAALAAAGFGDATRFRALLDAAAIVPGGRGPHYRIAIAGVGIVRIRPARHGGVLGRWLGERYRSAERVERELGLALALHAQGLPLPMPVAAISSRGRVFWRCHLATLERERARDGLAWLAAGPSPASLDRVATRFAHALRALHDAGVTHGDLQLRNLLIEKDEEDEEDEEEVRCLFVDLDRAVRRPHVSAERRVAELARLARSLEKRGLAERVDRRLRARVIAAYCGDDRALRASMRRTMRRRAGARLREAGHRLGWRIGRRLTRHARADAAGTLLALALPLGLALVAALAVPLASCERGGASAPHDAEPPHWSLLAVGDTGQPDPKPDVLEGQLAVAEAMTREARREPVDALVLLGDNFYDVGLLRSEMVARLRSNVARPYCHFLALTGPRSAELESACPIPASERRPVPLLAVLGNHDLESPESPALQRHVVPEFLPGWIMSDPLVRVVEIHAGISIVLFESEVAIDDRPRLRAALVDALHAAAGPWRILATHRPIATDEEGHPPVGGYPMWMRKAIAESGRTVQLVLSGHHHALEAHALQSPTPLLQIVVGSGSRIHDDPVPPNPDLRFAAKELGFARVDLVGSAPDDRLRITLYSVARWPWHAVPSRVQARFEVDREGRVSPGPPGPP